MTPSELLREQIRAFIGPYERYHDSKTNMAYLAAAAYVGGGISMIARTEPPWRDYSCFDLFMLIAFVAVLTSIVFTFVWRELDGRRYASDMIGAFINVFSTSLTTEFDASKLELVACPRFKGDDKWPRAIAEAFEASIEKTHKRIWMARFLPMAAMCLTLLAFFWQVGSILLSWA